MSAIAGTSSAGGAHSGAGSAGRARTATGTERSSAAASIRVRSGGRAATKPAASSPQSAVAGMNQVQSTAECTPNVIATATSAAIPTRSASHGSPRSRGRIPSTSCTRRPHSPSASSESASPTQPRSASVCGT